jgi:hypothetical protein
MVTIPFAFIGVVWGHIIMGIDLSSPSLLGFVSPAKADAFNLSALLHMDKPYFEARI